MLRSMLNGGFWRFVLLTLVLLGVAQGSTTQAAGRLATATTPRLTAQEQTGPDGSLPAAQQQLYLPLLLQKGSNNAMWADTTESLITAAASERTIIPQKYRTVTLDVSALQQLLQTTPLERSSAARSAAVILSLPLPDGTFGRFRIVEAPIMAPELAAKFPEIKTYAGQGLDDPTATVRFDWTPAGFHAQILAASGAVYIDPYSRTDTVHYISYYKRDYQPPAGRGIKEPPQPSTDPARIQELQKLVEQYQASKASNVQAAAAVGTQLRTYRMAMASNGEYTQLVGGTAAAMATIATTVNRVTGIYETEAAIRFVLVAGNDALIYTDPGTDPYTNNDTVAMLTENQTTLDTVIGNANYDIGHLLHTGPGGVAYTPAVCDNSLKAGGNSGNGTDSIGDPFIVDFVAHEIGHQFSAGHIFNDSGDCDPNRSAATAYEPGSGSTIMSYAGYCLSSDLQAHNDPLFNSASFEQIVAYSTLGVGDSCAATTNTGNTPPVVNAGAGGFTIPRQTPFTLTGSATDANGDTLTYSWEEHDLGDANGSLANNPLEAPFFRSFPPVTSPSRTFPKWSDIINNTSTIGEILPNVTRALNFRLTARDNRSGGSGVDYASTTINVTTAAGPFLVTAPNTAVTWTGNNTESVTWDVANTDTAPVSCTSVNILLSTDGGFTYPTTLATGVPNNGSANVTAPNIATTTARVQVVCANNIFFDISNTNFSITPAATTGTIIVRKATNPAGGTGFGFTSNIPGAASFTLDDGQNQTINNVAVGSYTVSENNPLNNHKLTALVCTDPDNGSTVTVSTRTATIDLDAGETVDCTFTNTKQGRITIHKATSPAGGTGFGFTSNIPGAASFMLNDAGNLTFLGLATGSYTVSENNPAGYSLTNLVCSDPTNNTTVDLGTRTATIDLTLGESVDCTFTNTQMPATGTIQLVKNTVGNNGTFSFTSGDPDLDAVSITTAGNTGQSALFTKNAGSYTVSEDAPPANWALTALTCAGDTDSGSTITPANRQVVIDLDSGENIICTFTNTFTPPPATGTIVISSDENGKVPGLGYRDEDIMAYNPNTGLWSVVFDGSDVGLGNVDVDGFAFLSNGHLLLSVDKDFTLSGFGAVDDSDILEFIPTSYGPTTSGSYAIYFDGSDVGLSSSDEDVDAIDFDNSGKLLISVNGSFKAPGASGNVTGNDEDLFRLTGFTPGANTSGVWDLYFDGSDVGLTSSGEDIFGLWADHTNSKLYLTTHDNFSVPGASGDEDDIFVCQYSSLGATTACTFSFFWNGDTVGFDEDAIDGLSIGDPPVGNGCVTTANAATIAQELSPDCLVEAESQGSVAVDDTVEYAGDDANEPDPLDGEETTDEAAQNQPVFLPMIEN